MVRTTAFSLFYYIFAPFTHTKEKGVSMKINKIFKKSYRAKSKNEFVSEYDPFGSYTGNVVKNYDEKIEQDADDL